MPAGVGAGGTLTPALGFLEDVGEQGKAAIGIGWILEPARVKPRDIGRGDIPQFQFAQCRLNVQLQIALVFLYGALLLQRVCVSFDVGIGKVGQGRGIGIRFVFGGTRFLLTRRINPICDSAQFLLGFVASAIGGER